MRLTPEQLDALPAQALTTHGGYLLSAVARVPEDLDRLLPRAIILVDDDGQSEPWQKYPGGRWGIGHQGSFFSTTAGGMLAYLPAEILYPGDVTDATSHTNRKATTS